MRQTEATRLGNGETGVNPASWPQPLPAITWLCRPHGPQWGPA